MIESRCSSISRRLDEQVWGTASLVKAWLLLEQPGPWGSEAVVQSRLTRQVAERLAEAGRRSGVRVILLRRPDRPSDMPDVRSCFVVYSGRVSPWVEHRRFSDPEELLSLDFAAVADGRRPGFGAVWTDPLYLVCTNGRHDPCCAQFGRPVAVSLFGKWRDTVWECSHIGGDRFAGNLVCFPHGLYFGRLGPAEASRVVDGYTRGRIELDHYRGRAGDPFVVQAAEFFVRRAEGLLGVDDLVLAGRRGVEPGMVEVTFSGAGGRRFRALISVAPAPYGRPLTCAARQEQEPPIYGLLSLSSE